MLSALILSAACHSEPAPDHQDHYLPEAGQVEGWEKSSATRTFPADQLYEYIDGDADRYLKSGVERVLTSDYRYGGKIEAVADVFVMKDRAGAMAAFESQPANGSLPVQIGDAGREYPEMLMFRQGRFFMRVVAYDAGPEVPGAMLLLGRAIEERVK